MQQLKNNDRKGCTPEDIKIAQTLALNNSLSKYQIKKLNNYLTNSHSSLVLNLLGGEETRDWVKNILEEREGENSMNSMSNSELQEQIWNELGKYKYHDGEWEGRKYYVEEIYSDEKIAIIRDNETAEIATKAAITGHLVLSTLHTNDSASSITRLVDMGIQPYLVSTSIAGVIAQRLVRRICPHCKEEYEADAHEKKILGIDPNSSVKLARGKGCGHCNNTGYIGRIGIYEIMEITREHRDLINHSNDANVLKDLSIKSGMTTLGDECKSLVLQGTTTINELANITLIKEA